MYQQNCDFIDNITCNQMVNVVSSDRRTKLADKVCFKTVVLRKVCAVVISAIHSRIMCVINMNNS